MKKQPEPLLSHQSSAISLIRVTALGFIIACHILQYYGIVLATWLNVGVEMFLFISGFIFGKQNILQWRIWFTKRAIRILPDYYITLCIAIPLLIYLGGSEIRSLWVIAYFTVTHDLFNIYVPGLGHLWYITCISFCYLMVPFFQFVRGRLTQGANAFFFALVFPFVMFLLCYFLRALPYRYASDMWIFALGYHLSNRFQNNVPKMLLLLSVILAFGFMFLRGVLEIFGYFQSALLSIVTKALIIPYSKVAFSFAVCLCLIYFGRIMQYRIINFLDRYSYNIYLTHVVIILGPLSILSMSITFILKLFFIVIISISSAIIIKNISDTLRRRLYSSLMK
jgi:peptidoglycan/LPS O-acetylase OafA/YrhL